jgi:SAM-dependent methyltransferase
MPFDSGSFDGIIASNVIEHVPSKEALISECARVLAPNGVLYLDGPNRYSPRMLWSDPHYAMLGPSILPGWLARAYVTKVRRYPSYDAETFPTATGTARRLERHGFVPVAAGRRFDGRGGVAALVSDFAPMFHMVARKPR